MARPNLSEVCFFPHFASLRVRHQPETHLHVAEWVGFIEQFYRLDFVRYQLSVAEIAEEDERCTALIVRPCKSAETGILVPDPHDFLALIVEDEACHGEKEELHVRALLNEELIELVPEAEHADILILGLLLGAEVEETDTLAIAGEDVVQLILADNHVCPDLIEDLIRQLVIISPWHIFVRFALDGD